MRTRPIALTAAFLVLVAGCTSADDSSGNSEPVTPVVYPTGSNDVLMQVGDYNFGWQDEFLVGPQIVVYGDGRAFAELLDPSSDDPSQRRTVTGELDDATIQLLLQPAKSMATDLAVGSLGDDEVPTLLVMNDRRWALSERPAEPLAALLTKVRDAIDEMPLTDWMPEQWTVRVGGGDCTLSDQPVTPSYHSAPIFPHLVGVDPFPDLDCGG